MFADPFSNLMLVLFLFFGGLLVMFVFIMRSLENNRREREEASGRVLRSLGGLEVKLGEILCRLRAGEDVAAPGSAPEDGDMHDVLGLDGLEVRSPGEGSDEAERERSRPSAFKFE